MAASLTGGPLDGLELDDWQQQVMEILLDRAEHTGEDYPMALLSGNEVIVILVGTRDGGNNDCKLRIVR